MDEPFFGSRALLMVIVGEGGARSAGEAIRGGADLVQVRAKHLSSRNLIDLVRQVVLEIGSAERVVVNSRPDIAALTGAWGVHLPESGLDAPSVRAAFPQLRVGVSRHDRQGLDRAVAEGADYALLGPVFETPGKEARVMGVAAFGDAVRRLPLPVFAVGGINLERLGTLLAAGASGAAAIRPFAFEATTREEARRWRLALDVRQ